ncbi:FitA-like ribbon-helix-helix domain-containing protein [Microlunatus speluncae]|uniref:FitA-like ribbon-helix-helix domain-containing protein n=1 Tax=Microlunatus speluncae TaxID=2594267 RepID=UPI001266483C
MATIIVRDLDDELKAELAALAAAHGRSMEAEVRVIIGEAVRRRGRNLGVALLERFGEAGGVELPTRPRAGSPRAASLDE